MDGLRVGEVAKQAGVKLETVRYYERRGLLPRPPRTESNYRAYPEDTVLRLGFIKRATEVSFEEKMARVLFADNQRRPSDEDLLGAIREAGYSGTPVESTARP